MGRVRRLAAGALLVAASVIGGCATDGRAATPGNPNGRDAAAGDAAAATARENSLVVADESGRILGPLAAFNDEGVWYVGAGGGADRFVYWTGCERQVYLMFPTPDCSGERAIPQVTSSDSAGSAAGATAAYNPVAGTLCAPLAGEVDEFEVGSYLDFGGNGASVQRCGTLVCTGARTALVRLSGPAWQCAPAPPPEAARATGRLRVVVQRP
jgi:hypothetical protein